MSFKVKVTKYVTTDNLPCTHGCYTGVDMLGLDKNGLLLWNEYTENKLLVPIEKDEMIMIFREGEHNEL